MRNSRTFETIDYNLTTIILLLLLLLLSLHAHHLADRLQSRRRRGETPGFFLLRRSGESPRVVEEELPPMVTNQPGKLSVHLRLLGHLGGGHESSALQQLGKTWPGETETGGQQNVDLRLRLMIGEEVNFEQNLIFTLTLGLARPLLARLREVRANASPYTAPPPLPEQSST